MGISTDNQIEMFFHCKLCMEARPANKSPQEWSRIEVGATHFGIQIWCKRHDANIMNIDFEGVKHPGIMGRAE